MPRGQNFKEKKEKGRKEADVPMFKRKRTFFLRKVRGKEKEVSATWDHFYSRL